MPAPGTVGSEIEVEWQFDALDLRPVERWLTQAPRVDTAGIGAQSTNCGSVTAEPLRTRRLVDSYLDTDDWRVGRAGFVLRMRQRAGGAEVTLKETSPARAGLRRRLEVTEPLPSGGVGALGPDGPVGRRLHALIGQRPLREVLEVRTRRRPYRLCLDGTQAAEVALDETVIDVAENSQPVRLRRVEVEVDPGRLDALAAVVGHLRTECGLQPATLSKFEAGLLASGLHIPGGPDVGDLSLPQSPSMGELSFVVLRRNFVAMLAHEAGTRLGEDPEELHDMRVATRRLRAALAMFADALPARARHVRSELGWLADALGTVRDLDIQVERVDQWGRQATEGDGSALVDLSKLLSAQRDAARAQLLAALESNRYERLTATFTAMLRQGPSRRLVPAKMPAVMAMPELVRARHRSVAKAAKRARRSGAADDFHALRIRGKRLRYALEFVSEIYGGQTSRYVRALVRLQDSLGLMQDARVAADRLHALAVDEGRALSDLTVFFMGGVAQRYRHEAAGLARKIPKKLDSLGGSRWQQLIGHMERRRLEATAMYSWNPARPSRRPTASPAPGGTEEPPAAGAEREPGAPTSLEGPAGGGTGAHGHGAGFGPPTGTNGHSPSGVP